MKQLNEERREAFVKEMAAHWVQHNRGDDKRTIVDAGYLEVYARAS